MRFDDIRRRDGDFRESAVWCIDLVWVVIDFVDQQLDHKELLLAEVGLLLGVDLVPLDVGQHPFLHQSVQKARPDARRRISQSFRTNRVVQSYHQVGESLREARFERQPRVHRTVEIVQVHRSPV